VTSYSASRLGTCASTVSNYSMRPVVDEAMSAAAKRRFSLLLRGLRDGRSYVVTSHGKPVARLIPVGRHEKIATKARTALLSRLEQQRVVDVGRWTRDELYEDDR
jgi:prevent-host-death family protein